MDCGDALQATPYLYLLRVVCPTKKEHPKRAQKWVLYHLLWSSPHLLLGCPMGLSHSALGSPTAMVLDHSHMGWPTWMGQDHVPAVLVPEVMGCPRLVGHTNSCCDGGVILCAQPVATVALQDMYIFYNFGIVKMSWMTRLTQDIRRPWQSHRGFIHKVDYLNSTVEYEI